MTDPTIRFAEMLQRVAKRHDFEVQHFETLTATGQLLLEDAAALRALAALVEQIETATQHRGFPSRDRALQLCHIIAAGYTPAREQEQGTPAQSN